MELMIQILTLLLALALAFALAGVIVLILAIGGWVRGWLETWRALRVSVDEIHPTHVVNPGDVPEDYHNVLILKQRDAERRRSKS